MAKKLTKAVLRLLQEVAGGDTFCVKAYSTARSAVASGLLEWGGDADEYGGHLCITEAGRQALKEPTDV